MNHKGRLITEKEVLSNTSSPYWYKDFSTTSLIINCKHEYLVEDINWKSCINCGQIKPL